MSKQTSKKIQLLHLQESSFSGLEKAIFERRSVRAFKKDQLTLKEISQLLWAAQGITDKQQELRAAPSAGALYPLEIFVLAGDIEGVPQGIYRYIASAHELEKIGDEDKRKELSEAASLQSWVAKAPAIIVICGVYGRTKRKYGNRAQQYVHMEVGAVVENIYLQGRALNIGTCFVGAFDDKKIQEVIGCKNDEMPLALLPVGKLE